MKAIPLTRELITIVDDEDYEWLSQWKWAAHEVNKGVFYARRFVRHGKRLELVSMHRLITDAPKGMVPDHLDGDPLNNTRKNLEVVTQRENLRRRRGKLELYQIELPIEIIQTMREIAIVENKTVERLAIEIYRRALHEYQNNAKIIHHRY